MYVDTKTIHKIFCGAPQNVFLGGLQKTVAFEIQIFYYWNQAGEEITPTKARLTSKDP
jgi:hypothetical protein